MTFSLCGGASVAPAREVVARGIEYNEGVQGPFQLAIDLKTGASKLVTETGPNARGILNDGSTEWHRDASSGVHVENSPYARTIAAMHAATARCIVSPREKIVTPSFYWDDVTRFGDYRRIGDLRLPYRIEYSRSDRAAPVVDRVQTYAIRDRVSPADFAPFSSPGNQGIAHALSTSVPLSIESGALLVPVMLDGKGPYRFFLDSGGHNLLFRDAAGELGLKTVGLGRSGGSGTGTVEQRYATVASTVIGAAWMSNMPFAVLDISGRQIAKSLAPNAAPIAGILGLETFERFAIRIDYDARRVTFALLPGFHYEGTGTALPFLIENDAPTIEGYVDGVAGRFMVDTGDVGELVLFGPFLQTSGLAKRYAGGGGGRGMGMGGETEFTDHALRDLRIGPYTFAHVSAAFSQQRSGSFASKSEAGLFGSDVLSRFNLTFDYATGVVYLEQRRR